MIKFNKSLDDLQYCLSFDLAKHLTGWSFVDIKNHKILLTGEIDTTESDVSCVWMWYLGAIQKVVAQCISLIGAANKNKMFVTKEQLPCQAGKFTTIQSLQALAQAHSTCDIAICSTGIAVYDDKGIHAASVKAYYKRILGLAKPSKDDIRNCILGSYDDESANKVTTLDISDSIAVIETLINSKWNSDVAEEIKVVKRERKQAVSQKKIDSLDQYIEKLEKLKKEDSEGG